MAPAVEHDAAGRAHDVLAQLVDETRLADSRLTRDQHESAGPGGRRVPALGERLALVLAPDVRRRGAQARGPLLRRLPLHGPHVDRLGQSLQRHRSARRELQLGAAARQQPHQLGDEDLAGLGERAQARRLDHRSAEAVVVLERHVAGRHADPHRERDPLAAAVRVERLLHRDRRGQGLGRARERDDHAVARALDDVAAVRRRLLGEQRIVGAPQLLGALSPSCTRISVDPPDR